MAESVPVSKVSSTEHDRHPIKPPMEKERPLPLWLTWLFNILAICIIPLSFWAGKLQTTVDNHSSSIEKQETRFFSLDDRVNTVKVELAKIEAQLESVDRNNVNIETYRIEVAKINEMLKSAETIAHGHSKELAALRDKLAAIETRVKP